MFLKHLTILALLCWTLAAGAAAAAEAAALSARLSREGELNRVEIALTERIGFRVFTLADPMRAVVEFPALDWRFDPPRAGGALSLISRLRLGLARDGAARLVIDLRAPARVAAAYTAPGVGDGPPRFVIDLAPTTAEAFAAAATAPAAGAAPPAPAPRPGPPAPRPRPKRHVVVAIDPGHGGRDAGASFEDIDEKDLVLDYALRLAARIEERPGFRAFLTREGDEFVRLRARVARARRAGADLFISIHADALEKGAASGASVYTLSAEASDAEAAELAASHNRADVIAGVPMDAAEDDLARILVDFARRETDIASVGLAEALVARLAARSEVLEGRAIQSAGFRVLKAPDVPSVLVEIGFLSAARDRARLTSPEGRDSVVEALALGVFDWVAAQTGARYRPAARPGGD